jgi:hypothetical protein
MKNSKKVECAGRYSCGKMQSFSRIDNPNGAEALHRRHDLGR